MTKSAEIYALGEIVASAWINGQKAYRESAIGLIDAMTSCLNGMNKHDRSKRNALMELRNALTDTLAADIRAAHKPSQEKPNGA